MAAKRRQLSEAEREERRRKERERLEQATAELLTSDGWRRWLRTRSVLHGYSLTNTLLIAQQCHARGIEPTYVAGFRAWLRLGRCVRKGEKGLRIWAPMRVKVRDEQGEESEERKLRFRSASVFDVSQTEPLPGVEPAPLSPPAGEGLGGESHADLLPALEKAGEGQRLQPDLGAAAAGGRQGALPSRQAGDRGAGIPAGERRRPGADPPAEAANTNLRNAADKDASRLGVRSDSSEARRASEHPTERCGQGAGRCDGRGSVLLD